MSAVIGLVIVAAMLGTAPTASPPAVSQSEKGARVSVVELTAAEDPGLAPYLRDRAGATWTGGEQARELEVRLEGTPAEVVVSVVERADSWAQRAFQVSPGDPTALRLAVWLFVRSTVSRAIAETPRAAAHAGGDDARDLASTASLASPEQDVAPPVTSSAATRPATPERGTGPAEIAGRATVAAAAADVVPDVAPLPDRSDATTPAGGRSWHLGTAVLAVGAAGADRLWSTGLGVATAPGGEGPGAVWAELAYAVSPGAPGLLVHRLPVALAVAVRPRWNQALELGFSGWAEPKLAAAGGRRAWALGVGAGPAVRWTGGVAGRTMVVRGAWIWAVRRQSYRTDDGWADEAPWTLAVAVGLVLP